MFRPSADSNPILFFFRGFIPHPKSLTDPSSFAHPSVYVYIYTGLFISPSGISELDCATTKTDKAERSISIARESLQVLFVLGALAYFQVPPLGGSRDWRKMAFTVNKKAFCVLEFAKTE